MPSTAESLQARYERTESHLSRARALAQDKPGSGRLRGKVGIVTGVGSLRGIGRATALLMAKEGPKHLYLLDFDSASFPSLQEKITTSHPSVTVTMIQGDAANPELIESTCVRAIEECGRLDFFFANAGIAPMRHLDDCTAEQFMETLRINTLSCFLALQHASKAMAVVNPAKGKTVPGGSIIMTASVAGIRSGAGPIDYSASKAAVNSLAKVGAYQLTGRNVRVSAICPGLIESGMTAATFEAARQRGTAGKIGQLNPLQRYGIAEEVAQVALFLVSDESSYVNGQEIAVDGGLTASSPYVAGKMH